ncbi:MAG TPA: signal peptide peptidase SppA [Acidobacteriota bacterium]|nr:signal peptide peptidase SppA [Acidobacteriota bacterium]
MKDFLKSFFATLAALAIVAGGAFFLLMILIAAASSGDAPSVPSKAVLVLDLTKPISDKPYVEDPEQVFRQALTGGSPLESVSLKTILDALDSAADDDRIKAVLVRGPAASPGWLSGWAALKEVREGLERFKESGKEVLAYGRIYSEADYYVASVANSIQIHPLGGLEMNGLASERMFYARAMQKYGVEMQILRVGKYKAAVEPYMLEKMSPENRRQTELLLADLFNPFLEGVAVSRGIEVERLNSLADGKALFKAQEAVECGLADEVTHFDAVRKHLQDLTDTADEDSFAHISISDYAEAAVTRRGSGNDYIAVVYAEGEIVDGASKTQVGGDSLAKLLRQAREDEDVKAVVLRVNSPGGSAMASEVIQRETLLIKEAGKPFVVSMGTVAASGGYWISAYADEIVAQPNTITGSIGVFGMIPNVQRLFNDFGITFDTAKTNQHADLGSIFRPLSEAEREILQGFTDQVYDKFLNKVAEGRNMTVEQVHEIAQGRVWSGREAQKLGLVDSLGSLQDALASAAQRAELGDQYRLRFYQRKKDFAETLMELLSDREEDIATRGPLESQLGRVYSAIERLRHFNDPNNVYARLEFDLSIR